MMDVLTAANTTEIDFLPKNIEGVVDRSIMHVDARYPFIVNRE